MSFLLERRVDIARHNEEVRALWRDYAERCHARVPVSVSGSIRNLLSNPSLNDTGFSFRDFFTKAEAQIACQLAYQYYCRHHLLCDSEMGLPEGGWRLCLDFQNSYEQAWLGCPFRYFGDSDVPDTDEVLKDDPEHLHAWPEPDAFWGRGDFMRRAMDMYEEMKVACARGLEFHGLPVLPPSTLPGTGTDGPFTVALKLRGTVETMVDMFENPAYFHALMDFVTRSAIRRRRALYTWRWDQDGVAESERTFQDGFFLADDSIAMLSPDQYREFVLPYHRQLVEAFRDGRGVDVHLCGDATHHFGFLTETFGVRSFDTGFPVDHGALRAELGPDVAISGGPSVMLIKDGTPAQIEAETRRICESGVMAGRRFILIAANNLAPCTPAENVAVFYDAAKRFGRYEGEG